MAQLYNRKVLRGGIFLLKDTKMERPMSWAYGEKIFKQMLYGVTSDLDGFWLELGNEVKKRLAEMIKEGRIPIDQPLSGFTKEAKGNDKYLFDKGTLADGFEPRLMKGGGKVTRGYAGVALVPNGSPSSHSTTGRVISNLRLLDTLTQQGLIVYSDEMSPDALRRLLAWRAQFFNKGEKMTARHPITEKGYFKIVKEQLGLNVSYRWFTKARSNPQTINDLETAKRIKVYMDNASDFGYQITDRSRLTEQTEKGRKLVIFIPPRPLFTNPVLDELKQVVRDGLELALGKIARVTAHSLGYETWDAKNVTKHEANIRSINLWGQERR